LVAKYRIGQNLTVNRCWVVATGDLQKGYSAAIG